jgi:hypothetical protein
MKNKKLLIALISIIIICVVAGLAIFFYMQRGAEGETPTIKLEIYDGPDYSESDNMCYYRVEAVYSGTPEPEIKFGEDDNVNLLGDNKAEVGVEAGDSYTLIATATNSAGTATASIELSGECGEEVAKEEEEAEEAEEEEEEAEEEEAEEEGAEEEEEEEVAGTAPTISLEIYEGPTPADGLCYYRIKATVTGTPTPAVTWSKDDSHGAWGTKKAQVNLTSPGETYTLTATATNSEGEATDSITLNWGCPLPNNPPEISEITVMGTQYINKTYGLGVSASDPDGDSLTYNWTVTGGTIDNPHATNINWTTPSTCGNYRITVTVSDGKGGEDSKSEDIYVHFIYDLLEKAPGADWYNRSGVHHLWNAGLDNRGGFACYRNDIQLEDNNTYPKVLETHPEWIDDGCIWGGYNDIIEIPEGARFKAKIGFIKGATGTDGAWFLVGFQETSGIWHHFSYNSAFYNGALDTLDIDLSSLEGKSGRIFIQVYAGPSAGQDWAVWVNPRIEN